MVSRPRPRPEDRGSLRLSQCSSQLRLAPPGLAQSSTSFGWGKGGNVASAGWQVTLCDPIWHVSSCSGEACCELLCCVYLYRYKQRVGLMWNPRTVEFRTYPFHHQATLQAGGKQWQPNAGFMTPVTCTLTGKYRNHAAAEPYARQSSTG